MELQHFQSFTTELTEKFEKAFKPLEKNITALTSTVDEIAKTGK